MHPDDPVALRGGQRGGHGAVHLVGLVEAGPGARAASVQSGWWVWAQSRNHRSSPRERGSTVTNRPPPPAMWPIASREHSLESAT